MVFKFRMLSDENDHFVRDYEVPYDMTLLGFHEFITRSLGYEEGMSSFFTADKQWNRLREFTLMDMGDNSEDAPLPMADITLGQLIHNNRDRLIYQFDLMGDRAYYLELTEAKKPEQGTSIWNWSTPGGMKKAARNCCWPTVRLPISSIPTPMSRKALFSRR